LRTVNYSEVLQLLSELAGIPYADLPTATALTYRGALSRYFRKAWEVEYWPELTRTDQRYYRPVWAAGTTYAAGAEVFFKGNGAASQSYFQSLRTGMPLTVDFIGYAGTLASVITNSNHNLVTGDWVTITGVTPAGYNLTAQITRTGAVNFNYTLAANPGAFGSGTMRCSPNPESSTGTTCLGWWHPCQASYSGTTWTLATAFVPGDVVYYAVNDTYYACHTASTGNLPTDTAYFGALTVFDKYVGYAQTGFTAIGDVRDVYTKNPLVNKTYATSNWTLSQNGVQVPNGPNVVWLEYRTRFAPLVGSDWASGSAYAVGDQVLFTSGSVKNFYTCAVVTTAGQSPTTHPASWTILEIPYLFQPYMVHGAFADVLRMDGQMDKAAQQERLAEQYLEIEAAKLFNLQPQQQRMDMSAAY
jgi:hypothetical protein